MSLTDDAMEQVQKLFRENQELQTGLNAAYRERAHLVAFLAAVYPSRWGYDPNATQWRIVYVDLPTGQASWHISPDDVALFPHVTGDGGDREWDGHTTAAKYERIDQLTALLAQASEPDEEQLGQMAMPLLKIEHQAQAERDADVRAVARLLRDLRHNYPGLMPLKAVTRLEERFAERIAALDELDAREQEGASCLCGCPLGRNCQCGDDVDHGDPRDPEGWAR